MKKVFSDKEKLEACQIYVDYVMQGCEGLGGCGALMFSDDKRIELHNKVLEVFNIKEENRHLIQPLSDNLNLLKFDGYEYKKQIERILTENGVESN